MKRNVKITIGVLIIFIGICLFSSTYYNTKKYEVFDDMNELYYEELGALDLEEIVEEPITEEPVKENEVVNNNNEQSQVTTIPVTTKPTTTTTTQKPIIDYSKYYVGYLEIPKIDLKRGFMDIDSKYNNVSKNILVHESSNYPDVAKGNLILASHSGTSSISFFKNLYKLEVNDDVYVNYNNVDYHYKVTKIYTDTKDGNIAIKRNKNKTTLTLITCTKNDKNTQTVYICELV